MRFWLLSPGLGVHQALGGAPRVMLPTIDSACISYLALTNQTTYEIARRRRITYLRGVPSKVYPFSNGICRNLYDLCLSREKEYVLEAVPPLEELESRARPYTCRDVICCRCC